MDKLDNSEDVKVFLKGLGLNVDEAVVRKILDVLSGKEHRSMYSLYASRPNKPPPLCGKGTISKIKKLYHEGKLHPYLDYLLASQTTDEVEVKQIEKAQPGVPKESQIEQKQNEEKLHKQQMDLDELFQELITIVGGTDLLNEYGLAMAGEGVFEYDPPAEKRPVFRELSILGLVKLEQRLKPVGVGHSQDQGYWILTEPGKAIIRLLKKQ